MTAPAPGAWARRAIAPAAIIASTACYLYFAYRLLLHYPAVWPDEALFIEPAAALASGSFGTPALDGALPGIEHHTLWMPPLYFVMLSVPLAIFGVGLETMRHVSLFWGLVAAGLTLFIGRRHLDFSPLLSAVTAVILLLDPIWLRGSLVGRMDMFTLALMLLAAAFFLNGPQGDDLRRLRTFALGLVCCLPALAHPAGLAAPLAVGIALLCETSATLPQRAARLGCYVAGGFVAALPWLAYISFYFQDFVVQFGGQLGRKAGKHGLLEPLNSLLYFASQAETIAWIVLVIGVTGWIGLAVAAHQRRRFGVVLGIHSLLVALAIYGREMWYGLYLLPGTALGNVYLIRLVAQACMAQGNAAETPARFPRAAFAIATCVIVGLSAVHLLGNFGSLLARVESCSQQAELGIHYTSWARSVATQIPPHATVYLASTPDPYFELRRRNDLRILEFLPTGIAGSPQSYPERMANVDYVVSSEPRAAGSRLTELLERQGELRAVVGHNDGSGLRTFVYRLRKSDVAEGAP